MSPPYLKLSIILILFVVGVVVSLPAETRINSNLILRRPALNINLGSFNFYRDLEPKLGLDLAGGSHLVFEADTSALREEDKKEALESARSSIERRINLFGVSEGTVQTAATDKSTRLIIELPGVKNTQEAVSLIGKTAKLDFREYIIEEESATTAGVLTTLENTKSTGFTGAEFEKATPDFDPTTGSPVVRFKTKPDSAKKFADITKRLVGKRMIIFLDEVPIQAPRVETPIETGSGIITGQFTLEETKILSSYLNAGALPMPIKLIEQRTVEASLGKVAVEKSIMAGLVGLSMVVLFMVLNYRWLGFLSAVGLLIYGVLTLSLYKLLPIVLTLPGVAGFILSVGMAVDSNILIFERMKEELRAGKPWADSMESAFGRAWDSIRDANIATLLTAFILFNPLNLSFLHTSGPVRGFALTLALGIALSLFTGLFVTRTLLRVFARKEGRDL